MITCARVVHCDYPPRAPQSVGRAGASKSLRSTLSQRSRQKYAMLHTPVVLQCPVMTSTVHVNTNAVHCAARAGPTASFAIYLCGDEQREMSFTNFFFCLCHCFNGHTQTPGSIHAAVNHYQSPSIYFMFYWRSKLP